MRTLVPFDARDPNSRLSPVLDGTERHDFANAMLGDVLAAVREAGGDPHVLSTAELPAEVDTAAPVIIDSRPLTPAVSAGIEGDTAVVMSDLALATPSGLRRAMRTPESGDVAAAPGLGGGTNVLVVRHPEFEPDYHGTSFDDHRQAARSIGAPFRPIDSFRLAVDVDGPSDLPEVLLHGTGRAADWLADAGFAVVVDEGRAMVVRD